MSRISGIIAFQTKKSNLERDLRKKTDIKWVTKGNRKIPSAQVDGTSRKNTDIQSSKLQL